MSLTGDWQCNYHLDDCAIERHSEKTREEQITKMTRIIQLEHGCEGKETKERLPQGSFQQGCHVYTLHLHPYNVPQLHYTSI